MTNYYIEKDNKIVLSDEDKQRLENTIAHMPQYEGLEIQETDRPIVDYQFADTEEYLLKQIQAREDTFNQQFFNTSLGYIRRKVTMATGETKDFLSDLLPTISMGIQMGQSVQIIAYDKPDFTQEITDWTVLQNVQTVTAGFVQECFMQLSNDFKPVNNQVTDENSTEQASDTSSNSSVGLDEEL